MIQSMTIEGRHFELTVREQPHGDWHWLITAPGQLVLSGDAPRSCSRRKRPATPLAPWRVSPPPDDPESAKGKGRHKGGLSFFPPYLTTLTSRIECGVGCGGSGILLAWVSVTGPDRQVTLSFTTGLLVSVTSMVNRKGGGVGTGV